MSKRTDDSEIDPMEAEDVRLERAAERCDVPLRGRDVCQVYTSNVQVKWW
jgi:hypothetical protein